MMAHKKSNDKMQNSGTSQMTENSKSTQTDPSSEESTMSDIEQQKETKRNLERDIATLKSEKIRLSMENANSKRELEETKAAKVTDEQENLRNGPRTSSQGAGAEGGRAVKSGDQTRDRDIQEHTEDSPHDGARLTNTPIMHLGRSLYIHFVLLLFKIAELFHLGDPNHVKKFKTWAREQFSADGSIHQILLYLYTTKVIDALDMRKLIEFFCRQDILRFDIRHIIDCFSIGDYALILPTVDVCQGFHPGSSAGTIYASSSGDINAVRDKCCICHQDAFTECHFSVCPHKVHKVCAISNKIIRCQICGYTFFPIQEENPGVPPRKHHGK